MRNTNDSLQKKMEQLSSNPQHNNVQSQTSNPDDQGNPTIPTMTEAPNNNLQPASQEPISLIDPTQQIATSIRKEMIEFKEAIMSRLPGVRLPVRKSRAGAISDTPFVESIVAIELPRKFSPPEMKPYDGSADPDDHIIHYKYKMMSTGLSPSQWEAGMCRCFGKTLAGPTFSWFINLPYRSIESYQ